MARYLYSELAQLIQARSNCPQWSEWWNKHTDAINRLRFDHMPSGNGFDSGTQLDFDQSHGEKLVFTTSFHHMDEGGYSGWTEHVVTVTPSFSGINIRISGRNRNDIKEYIHQAFDAALKMDVTYDIFLPIYPQFAITSKWEDSCTQVFIVPFGDGSTTEFKSFTDARERAASQMVAAHNNRHSVK